MEQQLIQQQIYEAPQEQHRKILFVDYSQIEQETLVITKAEIRRRLIIFFKTHIGIINPAYPSEIFEFVFKTPANKVAIYERSYYWKVIKDVLKDLRHDGTLFVMHRGHKFFVLHNEEELNIYKKQNDRHIKALENLKTIAEKWTSEKRWLKLYG